MSLHSAYAANPIKTAYFAAASLDAQGKPTGQPPMGNFFDEFANAYNHYAKQGTVLGAENSGGNSALLASVLSSQPNSPTPALINNLANALAGFWATVALEPGEPAHGGSQVVAVVNDASTKVSAFAAAISESITAEPVLPYYEAFISNIEAVVKTIVWTVTELTGSDNTPKTFVESIA